MKQRFREFYDSNTSQRVLRWIHSLCKASLETTLYVGSKPYKRIELNVSSHQLCILCMFNSADEVTYGQILDSVQRKPTEKDGKGNQGNSEDPIKASLVSLMSKKYPLLTKEPKGREFNRTDVFRINHKFVSPKRRLNIPMPTAKISEEEKEAAHENGR